MLLWLPEYYVAFVIFAALIIYLLTGGADFGAGIWDLFARGKNAQIQRSTIETAIGPIWETNHIWLIIVIVLMFVAFPSVFATASIALHIPLSIMLIGIVFRGSAFVFRTHETDNAQMKKVWGAFFSIGSILTPFMLGICLGAITSGNIHLDFENGSFYTNFISPWFQIFPIFVGLLTLGICAFLAANYLIFESKEDDLKQLFRNRAFISLFIILFLAIMTAILAKHGAPLIYKGLFFQEGSRVLFLSISFISIFIAIALFLKWDFAARIASVMQVTGLILGWALSQFPYLIVDSHTIRDSAAPYSILYPVLITLGFGAIALVPSYTYLYYVFKKHP